MLKKGTMHLKYFRHVAVSRRMMIECPRSVFDQIISSRDRKRPVVFFVMILEQGLNHNIAVVECVQAEKVSVIPGQLLPNNSVQMDVINPF